MGKRNEHLCPCGSGKRMKLCCRTPAKAALVALEESSLRLAAGRPACGSLQALEQRVALSPTNPMIWNDLGNEYAAAGQPEKAIAALKRARQVDPTFPLPLYNLGIHTLDRCVALQQSPEASTRQAEEMAWEAIGYFNASLVNDPDNAACHPKPGEGFRLRSRNPVRPWAHAMEAIPARTRFGTASEPAAGESEGIPTPGRTLQDPAT